MRAFKNITLLVVALTLFVTAIPVALLDALLKTIGNIALNIAIIIDKAGNAMLYPLFNDILITKDGIPFGNINKTISQTLGENMKRGTLTKAGETLCKILDFFDYKHCEKSA